MNTHTLLLIIQALASAVVLLAAFRALACSDRGELSLRTAAGFLLGFAAATGIARSIHEKLLDVPTLALLIGASCWVGWMVLHHQREQTKELGRGL